MTKKIHKQVVNIDIFGAYTQWGKTTLYVKKIVKNKKTNFLVAMPNSILSKNTVIKKIKKEMKIAGRDNYRIYTTDDKYSSAIKLSSIIKENYRKDIQNIFVMMGNVSQLQKGTFFTAIHDLHNSIGKEITSLIIDESDYYLITHTSLYNNKVGRDIEFDRVIDGAPRFKEYLFYTATIYTHAFWVFSDEDTQKRYNVKWHVEERGNNYWHFDKIICNTRDNLSSCFQNVKSQPTYTGNFKPIADIIDCMKTKNDSLYIHLMKKVMGQDKIRDELLRYYPEKAIITANQDGVNAYYKDDKEKFETLNEAADWCLTKTHSLIWIGGQSLERMQTLTDTNAKLLLNNMILFGSKSHLTSLIQVIGRMTGRYNVETWTRSLFAPSEVIAQFRKTIELEEYFYDIIRRNKVITTDDFINMPSHGWDLVPKRARNGTSKNTHSILPAYVFNSLNEAYMEIGKANVMVLQTLFATREEGEAAIKADSKIRGLRHAGNNDDHYRQLISNDPYRELLKRLTIFVTPDGVYIDNRQTQLKLKEAIRLKRTYVCTYNSKGQVLVWPVEDLGKDSTSYDLIKFDKAA